MIKIFSSPTAMTWFSYFVQFGTALFLLPVILVQFNAIEVSIWFIFYLIMGMSVLADFGFGPSIVRASTYFYSGSDYLPANLEEFKAHKNTNTKPNFLKLESLIYTANSMYVGLAFSGATICLIAGYFLVKNTLGMLPDNQGPWFAFYLVVLRTFLVIIQVKWASILTGLDQVAMIKRFESVVNLIKITLMFVLVIFGFGIFELMLCELLATVALLSIYRKLVKNWFIINNNAIRNTFKLDGVLLRTIWPPSWRLGAIQLGGYGINNSSGFIVAQLNSPELIAGFLLTQRIILFTRQVCQAPLYANLPRIFQLMASKQYPELRFFCSNAIRISLSLLSLCLIGIYFIGNTVLVFFGIDHQLVEPTVLVLMSISVTLEMHHAIHSQIFMGSNKVPFLIPSIVSAAAIVVIGYFAVQYYGIIGVVVTQMLVQLFLNNWYPVYLNLKLLEWEFLSYLSDIFSFPYFNKNR
jgi:O-antigen/teichoic acid export membrane protein